MKHYVLGLLIYLFNFFSYVQLYSQIYYLYLALIFILVFMIHEPSEQTGN